MPEQKNMVKPASKDELIAELLRTCPLGGCRHRSRKAAAPWCAACRAAETIKGQHGALARAYETVKRLNRRCQRAESVAEPRAYSDSGKRIAKYMYADLVAARHELHEAKARLIAIEQNDLIARDDAQRRAMSRCEAGTRGIYFIKSGPFVKIGLSANVNLRLKQFRQALAVTPTPIAFIAVEGDDYQLHAHERAIHQALRAFHYRGEWFHDVDAVREFIREHAQSWPVGAKEAMAS